MVYVDRGEDGAGPETIFGRCPEIGGHEVQKGVPRKEWGSFINKELSLINKDLGDTKKYCELVDSLVMARRMRPGQKNSLDALCRHFNIDNSTRELHGALLDAELLAEVYLALTGGQEALFQDSDNGQNSVAEVIIRQLDSNRAALPIIHATENEQLLHEAWLDELDKKTDGHCLWRMNSESDT